MKRASLNLAVLGLLLGGLLTLLPNETVAAYPAPRYALAAIRNTTSETVTYFYWWGYSKWDEGGSEVAGEVTLLPGASHYYAWDQWEEGSAPPLNVAVASHTRGRRDAILKEYSLPKAEAPAKEDRYYKKYIFGWVRDGRLDLFESW